MRIDPCEGIGFTVTYDKHPGAKGEDRAVGKKHTIVAACSATILRVGGPYNQIVYKPDDGSDVYRTAEHAKILVKAGDHVNIFDPVAQDALYREGQFKSTHFNGGDENRRTKFTDTVTHSQAEARRILAGDPVEPNERVIVKGGANLRNAPTDTATKLAGLRAGQQIRGLGVVYGKPINNNALWIVVGIDKDGYPNQFVWSGGTTDTSPHDLSPMQERPIVNVPPVVIEEPPVVVPPVIEEPPVIVPPVDTPEVPTVEEPPVTPPVVTEPPKDGDTPPVKNDPVVNPDISKIEEVFGKIADLINATLPPTQRKKIYSVFLVVNAILIPVYGLGVTLALAVGGRIGATIGLVTGVIGIINSGLTVLVNRLAKENVTK